MLITKLSAAVDAIAMNSENVAVIDNAKCTYCGICFDVCPLQAIRPNSENPAMRGQGMGRGLGGGGLGRGQGHGRGLGGGRGGR